MRRWQGCTGYLTGALEAGEPEEDHLDHENPAASHPAEHAGIRTETHFSHSATIRCSMRARAGATGHRRAEGPRSE